MNNIDLTFFNINDIINVKPSSKEGELFRAYFYDDLIESVHIKQYTLEFIDDCYRKSISYIGKEHSHSLGLFLDALYFKMRLTKDIHQSIDKKNFTTLKRHSTVGIRQLMSRINNLHKVQSNLLSLDEKVLSLPNMEFCIGGLLYRLKSIGKVLSNYCDNQKNIY